MTVSWDRWWHPRRAMSRQGYRERPEATAETPPRKTSSKRLGDSTRDWHPKTLGASSQASRATSCVLHSGACAPVFVRVSVYVPCVPCVAVLRVLCVYKGIFCTTSPDLSGWVKEGPGEARGLLEHKARSSSEQARRKVTSGTTVGEWEAHGGEPRAGSPPGGSRGQSRGRQRSVLWLSLNKDLSTDQRYAKTVGCL